MKPNLVSVALCALSFAAAVLSATASTIQSYSLPASAVASTQFTVTADSTTIPVYTIRTVSTLGTDVDFKTHVANFSASGAVSLVIDAHQAITSYSVHPTSYHLTGTVSGTTLTLAMADGQFAPQPTYLLVQINALEQLAVLLDPLETDIPASSGAGIYNVTAAPYNADATGATLATTALQNAINDASAAGNGIVFVPAGVFKIQSLSLKSNMTLYLAGGSVILASPTLSDYTGVFAPSGSGNTLPHMITGSSITNVTIRGRGWIDANVYNAGVVESGDYRRRIISPTTGSNLTITGISCLNNASWTINPEAIDYITVQNAKVINPKWVFTDGIDISGSHSLVERCFVHTGDDAMCSKAMKTGYTLTDVTFQDCVVSSSQASGVKAGMQAYAPHNFITFDNIDVLHAFRGVFIENNTGSAPYPITDISFTDIRVEQVQAQQWGAMYTGSVPVGILIDTGINAEVNRVTYNNITVTDPGLKKSALTGLNATYQVKNITFTNFQVAGTTVTTANNGTYLTQANTSNVVFNTGAVVAPTFTPAAGTYTTSQSVTISSTTAGAAIRYTTDGSTPTSTTGTLYSAPVAVTASATLKAIAYATGMTDSTVSSATYTIVPVVAAPSFSPGGGTYTSAQTVAISSTTTGASIRYTTDGSTPTSTTGIVYSAPVLIAATTTLKAIAYASGMTDSSVSSATYTIMLPVAAPSFSPGGGTYTSAQTVTIGSTTTGASIRYTTDGSTPTSTTGIVYSAPVAITATTTLKAIAYASGMTDSAVTNATYTITTSGPITFEAESLTSTCTSGLTITPASDVNASGGAWVKVNANAVGQYIEFTTTSLAAGTYQLQLRYRTNPTRGIHNVAVDGTAVGGTIDQYAAGTSTYITVTVGNVTFSATGTHAIRLTTTGHNAASTTPFYEVSADSFILTPQAAPVATPTFTPGGGSYTSTQSVTMATTTSGASIRYTTDGSTPTSTTGTLYSTPVTVSASSTLKAIAYESGMTDSAVASASYTITLPPPITLEAESLTSTCTSGRTITPASDTNASGGAWVKVNANAVGQYIEFTTTSIAAGTYQLQLRYRTNPTRGIHNVTVDGTALGGTIDQYAAGTSTYITVSVGTLSFSTTGTHAIRLTTTGHNAASTTPFYEVSADCFVLTPQ